MTVIFIFCFLVLLIYLAFKTKPPVRIESKHIDYEIRKKEQIAKAFEQEEVETNSLISTILESKQNHIDDSIIDVTDQVYPLEVKINSPISAILESKENHVDDSIIDVSNQLYLQESFNNLKKYSKGVPFWSHQYVYSYAEINQANNEQKLFYRVFKSNFLSEHFFDLEGNTNYAFLLLFDLLSKFDKDISKLEFHLKNLGQHYPKTKSYAISFLLKKMELEGYSEDIFRVMEENEHYVSNYWKLGYKYRDKLQLSDYEIKLLNNLVDTNNKFNSIEFCAVQIISLVLNCKYYLEEYYKKNNIGFENIINEIAHQEVSSRYKFKEDTSNFKSVLASFNSTVYQCLYKTCENALRDYLKVGRKTDLSWYLHSESSKVIFKAKVLDIVEPFLEKNLSELGAMDLESEIEINNYSRYRYKNELFFLFDSFSMENLYSFEEEIEKLVLRNKGNPYIENIYFESSKFMVKYDASFSLKHYVKYLYLDLQSTTFDNKKLSTTIQKSLFKTNEQLHDFEQIVSGLIKDKDLDKALLAVPKIYEVKRKKIQLDKTTIKEVQQQHSGTVDLLNEYLSDEYEDENNSIQSQEVSNDEIKIEITQKKEESPRSMFLSELSLNPIHISILELFLKNNFSIPQIEIEEFAKSKGVFKNQIIESINETCYEVLDDVLIEEEDDYYTIIPEYFHEILVK
jgi:hypothetical protein